MKINQLILGIMGIAILVGIAFLVFPLFPEQKPEKPTDQVLTEDIGNTQEKSDLIRLSSPRLGEVVTSPLTIRGEARGNWFFEASFPVVLTDTKGQVLAGAVATAQGDWMTEEFVPFKAVLKFDSSKLPEGKGILVLKKDNPSGLPENDDALKVPVSIGVSETKTPVDDTQSEGIQEGTSSPSYQNLIDYISSHITEIISAYSTRKATNGRWFADGFGFTSARHVYVDFEDGHFLFRALLECDFRDGTIACTPLAILERREGEWIATEGTDSQKDRPIIHTWAKDYEWQR